ncbi:unnamed protein product, partial [Anisakis simplex]|uniref:Transposase n=1 Tax=Anisakis simplex TaxID=6269 RepID=A0A0M3KKC3_ANISI
MRKLNDRTKRAVEQLFPRERQECAKTCIHALANFEEGLKQNSIGLQEKDENFVAFKLLLLALGYKFALMIRKTNNSKKTAFVEDYGAIENTRGRILRFLYTESSGTIASMDFRTGVDTVSRRTSLGVKTGVFQPFKDATALDSMKT